MPRFREDEFPDGKWWVRWVDYVSQEQWVDGREAGANPVIRLVLSRWEERQRTYELVNGTADSRLCTLAVGWLPTIAIGHIFSDRDNLRDRHGRVRSIFGVEENATLDLKTQVTVPIDAERVGKLTHVGCDFVQVLPPFVYPCIPSRKSQCVVVLAESGTQVIIPCSVVITAFMARDVRTMTALFAGDWAGGRAQLIDVALQRRDAHEPFELRLLADVPDSTAPHLVNLLEGRSRSGVKAVNLVQTSLLRNTVSKPDLHHKTSDMFLDVVKAARIAAAIPFDAESLRMRARGLQLRGDVFLVTEILDIDWPDKRPIVVIRGVGEQTEERGQETPGGGRYRRARDEEANPERHAVGQPGFARYEAALEGFGGRVFGLPAVTRRTEPVRAVPRDPADGPVENGTTDGIAVGTPIPGGTAAGAEVDALADPGLPTLFQTLEEAMRQLQAEGTLKLADLPLPVRAGKRGALDVWLFDVARRQPGRIHRHAWPYFYDPVGGRPTAARCALVRAFERKTDGGQITHWFEIEPRPNESFSSIVVRSDSIMHSDEIETVLDALYDEAGHLDKGDMNRLRNRLRALDVASVSHRRGWDVDAVKRSITAPLEIDLAQP